MTNPYSATAVDLSQAPAVDDTYQPQIFAVNGRIGRLRYMAYSMVTGIVTAFIAGILAAILIPMLALSGGDKGASFSIGLVIVMLGIYVPSFAAAFIMAKRRLNDLNQSGWLSLLLLVPLLNLIFALYVLFAPGTQGSNNYGPKPVKNSPWLWIGVIAPFFFVGILAAIAIPQYQNYVNKAKAAQSDAANRAIEQSRDAEQPRKADE